jgi:hypothetical protein
MSCTSKGSLRQGRWWPAHEPYTATAECGVQKLARGFADDQIGIVRTSPRFSCSSVLPFYWYRNNINTQDDCFITQQARQD